MSGLRESFGIRLRLFWLWTMPMRVRTALLGVNLRGCEGFLWTLLYQLKDTEFDDLNDRKLL